MDGWIEIVVWLIAGGLILPVLGMGAILVWKAWHITSEEEGERDE